MLSFQVHDLALQIVFKLVKLSFHVHDLTLIGINWFVNAPNHSHWILLFVATGFAGRFRAGLRYELNPTSGFKRDVTNYPHWILLFVATGFAGRFRADLHYKLNPISSWPRSSYLSVMSQIHIFKYNFMSSSCSYPSSSYNNIHVFKFILNSGFPKLPKSHPQRSWIRIKAIDVTRE